MKKQKIKEPIANIENIENEIKSKIVIEKQTNIFEEIREREKNKNILDNTGKKNCDSPLVNAKNKKIYFLIAELIENINKNTIVPYNPILIRGKNETGKTYILKNIEKNIQKKVTYLHAKEISLCITHKEEMRNFMKDLEQFQCIIIDDIHLLANEAFLQEQISFLIEMFVNKNKILIISVNTEIQNKELNKTLLSRISMGLVILLPEPDLDIRMQYVHICLEEYEQKLNKELALYIARKCFHLRQIRSAIINIKTFYINTGYTPNFHDLDMILQQVGNNIHLDYEYIISVVGKRYGYTTKEIKSNKRDQRLIEARQICMYLCRKLLGDTYEKIGKNFNGKDHTTVIYSIKKIEEIIVRNKVMHNTVTELSNLCKT